MTHASAMCSADERPAGAGAGGTPPIRTWCWAPCRRRSLPGRAARASTGLLRRGHPGRVWVVILDRSKFSGAKNSLQIKGLDNNFGFCKFSKIEIGQKIGPDTPSLWVNFPSGQ